MSSTPLPNPSWLKPALAEARAYASKSDQLSPERPRITQLIAHAKFHREFMAAQGVINNPLTPMPVCFPGLTL